MSIETVKSQIANFLKSDHPEVMAIKGGWGVGKTYSWNKFLLTARNNNGIALKKYSYISLFGLNSLDAFKYSIFEQVVPTDLVGSQPSIETFKQNTVGLLGSMGRKSFNLFRESSLLKGLSPAIQSLSFLWLTETLICIDDLERRGSFLCIKDVLGLVSFLKEQKKCKIVLLLNDGEDGLEDYAKYREKVIDTELWFAPTSSECVSIALDTEEPDMALLAKFAQKLDIRNIRILKKIERLVMLVRPLLSSFDRDVAYRVVHSLTLFSWCYYRSDNSIPTLDYVTNRGYSAWGIGDEFGDQEHKKWKSALNNYEYLMTDELDLVLASAVRTGYFVEADILREASKQNQLIVAAKSENSFSEAWEIYHGSLENNQSDVIARLYESFMVNVKNITPLNLNGTVTLFRELGENEKASELIAVYLEKRRDEKELFDLKTSNFFGDVRDSEIVDKFNRVHESTVTPPTAAQVLAKIVEQRGWDSKDENVLVTTTPDQYYAIFKSLKGKDIALCINACLQFGRSPDAPEQQKKISVNAIEALKRIAAESEINRRRVKKFGIEIDNA